MKKESDSYFIKLMGLILGTLFLIFFLMIFVDPYMHFHGPVPFISYRLTEERYQNDGIGRHYSYDAIITGTSMSQNFKTSEFDDLFGVHSIKMPFSGGGYMEILENLERCLKRNPECRTVLLCLDYNALIRDPDWDQYPDDPYYLYDDDPFNDASYILNKDILYKGLLADIKYTLKRYPTTSMDQYSSWEYPTGLAEIIKNGYARLEEPEPMEMSMAEDDRQRVVGNLDELFVPIVQNHPEVKFYIVFPPYSIVSFDDMYRKGRLEIQFQAEEYFLDRMADLPNAEIYSFFHRDDIICDLEHYRDTDHYDASVNSMMLHMMKAGEGRITRSGISEHMHFMRKFFMNYDYDAIFEDLKENG